MGRFDGKVVVVTGGTRGIGRACAEAFVAEGAKVALCGRSQASAEEAAASMGGGARGYACDMADPDAVKQFLEAVTADLGPVSILVNNAGITRDGLLMRMKDADWHAVMETNLTGMFYTCRAVARDMLKQRYGRIINLSSIVGIRGQGGQSNYAAAKAGIIGFSKAYAQEVASRNITVNVVAPGYIETDMTANLGEAALKAITERIPMGRAGQSAEIAKAVLFLASDDASYITGTVLQVDGGMGM